MKDLNKRIFGIRNLYHRIYCFQSRISQAEYIIKYFFFINGNQGIFVLVRLFQHFLHFFIELLLIIYMQSFIH